MTHTFFAKISTHIFKEKVDGISHLQIEVNPLQENTHSLGSLFG
jgi:FtsZ-binding cell division protein ZapB